MSQFSSCRFIFGITLFLACATGPLAATVPFINEIHYDNDGDDTGEAVEIAGSVGTDLSGWSLLFYNGNGGSVYKTTSLNGTITDQQNGYGTLSFPTAGIQNGSSDGIALVDSTNSVFQFLSYEGVLTAVGGAADGMTSLNIGIEEYNNEDTPVGYSLQLIGLGTSYENFTWDTAAESFGGVNPGQTFGISAVPLPASFWLFGFALTGMLGFRRLRKNQL